MTLEVFRCAGSDVCALTLMDTVEDQEIKWRISLENPWQFVLAFANGDASEIAASDEPLRSKQIAYFTSLFAHSGSLLHDLISQVLVCKQEQGFDAVLRLAAYTFTVGLFDMERSTRYTEKATLETSVLGETAMEQVAQRWGRLMEKHRDALLPQPKEELFEALVADAMEHNYPFELSFCQEYSSFSHLMKSFLVEMIRKRILLKQCITCGRYFLSSESTESYCPRPNPKLKGLSCRDLAPASPKSSEAVTDETAKLYKKIYNAKQSRVKRIGGEKYTEAFEQFKESAKNWRLRCRKGIATQEDYLNWLLSEQ
ncbi:MAG: DUF6076 domain-containing protein [Oscillospiraceae bacterium]|jgi:hypothetical protein|nr:DUF6076 domain-containing protein [Oscillospiraceae bacterium]